MFRSGGLSLESRAEPLSSPKKTITMPEFEHTDLKREAHKDDIFVPKQDDTVKQPEKAVDLPSQKDPVPGTSTPPRAEEKVALAVKEADVDEPVAAEEVAKPKSRIRGRWKLESHIRAERATSTASFGEVADPAAASERLSGNAVAGKSEVAVREEEVALPVVQAAEPAAAASDNPAEPVYGPAVQPAEERPPRRSERRPERAAAPAAEGSEEDGDRPRRRRSRSRRRGRGQNRDQEGGESSRPVASEGSLTGDRQDDRQRGSRQRGGRDGSRSRGRRSGGVGPTPPTMRSSHPGADLKAGAVESGGLLGKVGRFVKGIFGGSGSNTAPSADKVEVNGRSRSDRPEGTDRSDRSDRSEGGDRGDRGSRRGGNRSGRSRRGGRGGSGGRRPRGDRPASDASGPRPPRSRKPADGGAGRAE